MADNPAIADKIAELRAVVERWRAEDARNAKHHAAQAASPLVPPGPTYRTSGDQGYTWTEDYPCASDDEAINAAIAALEMCENGSAVVTLQAGGELHTADLLSLRSNDYSRYFESPLDLTPRKVALEALQD